MQNNHNDTFYVASNTFTGIKPLSKFRGYVSTEGTYHSIFSITEMIHEKPKQFKK